MHCIIYGKNGDTGRVTLENDRKNFHRSRVDTFIVECSDVGELQKFVLGHDNHGAGAGWFVEKAWIECPSLGKVYTIPIDIWFATDEGDARIEREFKISEKDVKLFSPKGTWVCTTYTSDVRFAGTDANVHVTVFGDDGHSEMIPLKNKDDDFERGKVDSFRIELPAMGIVRKLRIEHDGRGLNAGWKLDKVTLQHTVTGIEYEFPCDR